MKPRLFRILSNKNTELNQEIDKANYFFSNVAEVLESKKVKFISASFISKLEAYKKMSKKEKEMAETNIKISHLADVCYDAKNNKSYPESVRLLASRIYHLCNSICPKEHSRFEIALNERGKNTVSP